MPSIPFVSLKHKIRDMHADAGTPVSSREAHRLARGIDLTEYAAQLANASESYFRDVSDETGEIAVNKVLIDYLSKYGALTAPRVEVLAA